MSEEGEATPREVDAAISEKIGELLDFSSDLTRVCRKSALDWDNISNSFSIMSAMAAEISRDQATLAASGASAAAAIIAAEWRLDDDTEEESDDDVQGG